MELILGGYAQGQLDFAKSCYPDAVGFSEISGDFSDNDVKIWDNFNISVKKMIESGKSDDEVRDMIQKIITFHKNLVIISDEIGCGIIPMSANERHFREFIGRIQCFLAEKVDKVFRVVCGIPQRIK
jgi:adenosyl cobinamide kinase/adenosyl cobinamide phosphate guanylyltransferase